MYLGFPTSPPAPVGQMVWNCLGCVGTGIFLFPSPLTHFPVACYVSFSTLSFYLSSTLTAGSRSYLPDDTCFPPFFSFFCFLNNNYRLSSLWPYALSLLSDFSFRHVFLPLPPFFVPCSGGAFLFHLILSIGHISPHDWGFFFSSPPPSPLFFFSTSLDSYTFDGVRAPPRSFFFLFRFLVNHSRNGAGKDIDNTAGDSPFSFFFSLPVCPRADRNSAPLLPRIKKMNKSEDIGVLCLSIFPPFMCGTWTARAEPPLTLPFFSFDREDM